MTYVIAEPCVDLLDKACIEECPVDCIYEGGRMMYIHPDECVDCGACEPVCPVEAIYYEDDVPEQWAAYTKANVDFFDELGSPGGASKVGKVERDVEPAAGLPPQEHDDGSEPPTQISAGGSTPQSLPEPSPTPRPPTTVFISYRHRDEQFSRAVAEAMQILDVTYYFALEKFSPTASGRGLVEGIEHGLDTCRALVGLITRNVSGSWWVPFEIGGARGRGKETMYVVFHDIVPEDVPDYLKVSPIEWSRSAFVAWLISLRHAGQPAVTPEQRRAAEARLQDFMSR